MKLQTLTYQSPNLGPFADAIRYANEVNSGRRSPIALQFTEVRVYALDPAKLDDALAPSALRVAIAGAYNATDEEKENVRAAITTLAQNYNEYLRLLRDKYPSEDRLKSLKLVFVSGGAAGADQAGTTAALDEGYTVLTIRPDTYDEYKNAATTRFGYDPKYLPESNENHIYIQVGPVPQRATNRAEVRNILAARDPIIQAISHAYVLGPLRDANSSTTQTLLRVLEDIKRDEDRGRPVIVIDSERTRNTIAAIQERLQQIGVPVRVYNPKDPSLENPVRPLWVLLAGGIKRLLTQRKMEEVATSGTQETPNAGRPPDTNSASS